MGDHNFDFGDAGLPGDVGKRGESIANDGCATVGDPGAIGWDPSDIPDLAPLGEPGASEGVHGLLLACVDAASFLALSFVKKLTIFFSCSVKCCRFPCWSADAFDKAAARTFDDSGAVSW